MFQEKKQEVQTAILRVDQLSQQLEDLKKGKLNGFQPYNGKLTGPAALELKRLYQELQVAPGLGWGASCLLRGGWRPQGLDPTQWLLR